MCKLNIGNDINLLKHNILVFISYLVDTFVITIFPSFINKSFLINVVKSVQDVDQHIVHIV